MDNLTFLKDQACKSIDQCENKILRNVAMSKYSTFKAGGNADLLFLPHSSDELVSFLRLANSLNVKTTILGNGSNILVSDKGIRGATVILGKNFSGISLEDETIIRANAGALLSTVSHFAYEKSLTKMEFAAGIPGTIGGAIFMNAGAYDGCMGDVVIRTRGYDTVNDKIFTLDNLSDHKFAYRQSYYNQNNSIVLDVWLNLEKGQSNKIKEKMDEYSTKRKNSQPLEMPSAGSTFKRPVGYFAGQLIEQADLKGYRIGGASVSTKHAGFIINDNDATAQEIMELILHVQKKVKENSNVTLELEVKILGEW